MEDKPEKQQLQDITAQLQRARRAQVRTSAVIAQQKDTLKRLIELTQSPYSQLKTIAAQNIKVYIGQFPELEDDAINAVYDLCEDPDPKVRKEGYRAITSVSKELRKWVKRNADVLVQLLQSDEPEEVEVVEQQLNEHLDMDSLATLNVLRDQIVPPEEPQDEDDQVTRDRLRGLVLNFLTGRGKRHVINPHGQALDHEAEKVLAEALLQVLPKLPPSEGETVAKELLIPLPSFARGSVQGSKLMEVILESAKTAWKSENPQAGEQTSLPRTRIYLGLANDLVQKGVGPATTCLRFYLTSFVSKTALQSLTDDAQCLVITHVADALSVLLAAKPGSDEYTNLIVASVNGCGHLFATFADLKAELKPWSSCVTLLKACKLRRETAQWKPSVDVLPTYQSLLDQASSQEALKSNKAASEEVQSLIRPILQSTSKPSTPAPSTLANPGPSNVGKGAPSNGRLSGGRVQIKRKMDLEPSRPTSTPHARTPPATSANTPVDSRGNRSLPPHLKSNRPERQRTQTAPSSTRTTPGASDGEPQQKRQRGIVSEPSVPSLLDRLKLAPRAAGESKPEQRELSIPAKRRVESEGASQYQQKRLHSQRERASPADSSVPEVLSIKGAAARAKQPTPDAADEVSSSLLHRLNRSDQGMGGGAKRRRTKT